MKRKWIYFNLGLWLARSACAAAIQFTDPNGDTAGPDITRLDYQIVGQMMEIRLTFAQELEGHVIDPAVSADIGLDIDRSAMTGFVGGPGFHTRFGIDYRIEVFLGGFGPTSNSGTLTYWRRKHPSVPPLDEVERIKVTLGDAWEPNGSVFVAGANPAHGTDSHQVFLQVPLSLLNYAAFPICGEGASECLQDIFPCPLGLVQDAARAYVSVFVMDPYDWNGTPDLLPDQGMIDGASGAVISAYPTGPDDLAASVLDPADDGWAQPGINGEELIGFKAFRHPGNTLSFELQLQSYSFEDTAAYYVLLDLDNNAATGWSQTNGTLVMGVDLLAQFGNFDNPIGEANPLAGALHYWRSGAWCLLSYVDYLASVWRATPGGVYITLPAEFTADYLAANTSGRVKAVAGTEDPDVIFAGFNDLAPNEGALEVALESAPSLQITACSWRPDRKFSLRFSQAGTALSNLRVLMAPEVAGPWVPAPAAAIVELGGGVFEAVITPGSSQGQGYYRVAGTP